MDYLDNILDKCFQYNRLLSIKLNASVLRSNSIEKIYRLIKQNLQTH